MSKVIETKQDAEEFLTYIGFLQSGACEKGIGSLQAAFNPKTRKMETWRYCALGVGAELFIPDDKKSLHKDKDGYEYMTHILIPSNEHCPLWLRKLNHENIFDANKNQSRCVCAMSDSGESFEYIAELLLNHFSDQLEEALAK